MSVRDQIKQDVIDKTNEIAAFVDKIEKIKESKFKATNTLNYEEAARLREEEKAAEKEYQLLVEYI